MKQSKRQREIEARRAADPIAQALGRNDIDYESDDLPTAPRIALVTAPSPNMLCPTCKKSIGVMEGECTGWHPQFKCDCGFESSSGVEYRFCPMCGKSRPAEIFNDGVIQGRA